MRIYRKECPICFEIFTTTNVKKIYDRPECRRAADNERKKDRRAEAAELREEFSMPDDWAMNDLGEDVMQNSLTDGWTAQCEMCADEAIAGPAACLKCHHWQSNEKSRRKDKSIALLCWGCRNGCRV